jgi:hypothetical protein
MAILLLLAALGGPPALVASATDGVSVEPVLYLVAETTTMRAAPHTNAPVIRKLQQYELLTGRETIAGWLHVEGASSGDADGWIAIDRDNVLRGPLETLKRRLFRIQEARWPERVKLDVARGRIREGFTADQVRLALGDPLRKELQRSGDSVSEAWTYESQRVHFSHTGVRDIERLPR